MKIRKTPLAKAVTLALTGITLSAGAITSASAHVAYNTRFAHSTYTPTDSGDNKPDGWVWQGNILPNTDDFNPRNPNNFAAANPGFAGTSDSNGDGYGDAPLNYIGSSHLNWAAMLHSAGASQLLSQQHAFDTYGVYADIDTTGGGWKDAQAIPQGWRHNTDIGLFQSDVSQNIHLNISAINGPIANFGVTVFEGQDTNTAGYGHHGAWNTIGEVILPEGSPNPFDTTGLDTVVGWSANVDSTNAFTFEAQAGQVYSIYLGGSGGTGWNQQHDGYVLNITSSPVPVPAAAWLFGTALAGLGVSSRRKSKSA